MRTLVAFALALLALSCSASKDIAAITYSCGTTGDAVQMDADAACGAGDPNLPPEPSLPTDVCQTLASNKSTPDENNLDTMDVQSALTACKGKGAVKLVTNGANNVFVVAHLVLDSTILWVDAGVTLYASRNADLYQKTGNCGVIGVNDSGACSDFITVQGTRPGIVGDGTIDGQGGEPLVGHAYSWWQMSGALQEIDGSIGNPNLINLATGTTGFLLYRITLHNSPKFHVKVTSSPPNGTCVNPGDGFTIWGVTILTPSNWLNSQGLLMSPHFARNTDGIDPGTTNIATCGVIACSTISTGDDHIAMKGGHWVSNLVIAHDHLGTGHGLSIGSETYGVYTDPAGVVHRGVENVLAYDITIDADSRPVGSGASNADSNGIRIKSDTSRGGLVNNVTFKDICMRDVANALLVSTAYNPLFSGDLKPEFRTINFQNIRGVTCMSTLQPVVTLSGFNTTDLAGPITLDNVIIDNVGPSAIAASYANIQLGPGNVNFMPSGPFVTTTNNITGGSTPKECVFPKLPVPELPPGWLR